MKKIGDEADDYPQAINGLLGDLGQPGPGLTKVFEMGRARAVGTAALPPDQLANRPSFVAGWSIWTMPAGKAPQTAARRPID
jgi:hypothetical protein